jgi:hypothetical protein
MSRRFTLEEAESLLPELRTVLSRVISLKEEHDGALQELRQIANRIAMVGGALVDRHETLIKRNRQLALANRLKECVGEVEEHGCVVKDLDLGLIDFPTLYRGREVYLCWKYGEPGIRFWHGVDEGFAGRKPIDEEFIRHHSGDPAS